MVFCVSKCYEPLGGSLTYQVLKVNTVHPQARLEFQLLEGRVLLDCQSQLRQKGLCGKRCFSLFFLSHPFALSHDGLRCSAYSKPISGWIRVSSLNKNLDLNWEVQSSLTIYTMSILLTIFDKTWSITFLMQVIEAIRDLSLASEVVF